MALNLLIDTSVWLDLPKDPKYLPLLDALFALTETGEIVLILPQTVVDEFARNRDRVIASSRASLASHFKKVREAIVQFGPEEGRQQALEQINEVDHRIATGGQAVNEAVEIAEKLFASTAAIAASDDVKARAADRAIARLAPFHRDINSIGDAIILETYVDALAARGDDDVFAFVTHNIHDFSQKGADTRLPHADLAPIFEGTLSRYTTNLAGLLGEFANDLIEESTFEREFTQEPRQLSQLLEAQHTLFLQVWYNRKWNIIARVEEGTEKIVTSSDYEAASPEARRAMMAQSTYDAMLAAMKRTEEELGPDNIGPWSDFEWGMLNGKLSAIRWVLGDEWDLLDT